MILSHVTVLAATLLGWSDVNVTVTRSSQPCAHFRTAGLAELDRPTEPHFDRDAQAVR